MKIQTKAGLSGPSHHCLYIPPEADTQAARDHLCLAPYAPHSTHGISDGLKRLPSPSGELVRSSDSKKKPKPTSHLSPIGRPSGAVLMIEGSAVSAADLLLQNADFPENFINMAHPDDYCSQPTMLTEDIFQPSSHNSRLLVRISWRENDISFYPMTFVCDTGAPRSLYLSGRAIACLKETNRFKRDIDMNVDYVQVPGLGKSTIEPTPPGHAPANIMGLPLLMKLGLCLDAPQGGFSFTRAPSAW